MSPSAYHAAKSSLITKFFRKIIGREYEREREMEGHREREFLSERE